ncbi:hypothetical protein J1N35_033014 [Gossypium stocksii]|uniref:CTLH domain-containing protein n=1 Tax=Gossypium stocksii TaxID=47602 RepID=A0A9D3UR74_9ROSI|nr:hypothetical protein J1N35_033014 [Gossypium stocksii]
MPKLWQNSGWKQERNVSYKENKTSPVFNDAILDTNPELFFHLQQQRLIELIRNEKIEEALEFAQEELAPRGEENQSFLEELERTVSLLVFKDVSNCPLRELLDISQRLKTANDVNAAILTSQSHETIDNIILVVLC